MTGAGWGGGFPTEGGTLVGPLTIDTGSAPAFEIDSSATSGTLARINFDTATTQAGAYIGLDIDLTTNLTDNDTAITGLRIQTDSTAAAAAAGQGALVINSDATLARVLDIDVANTAGTIGIIRYGAATTQTAALIGLDVDLTTNLTDNDTAITGLRISTDSTAAAAAAGEGALVINSDATLARVVDIDVANTASSVGMLSMRYGSAATLTGLLVGIRLDLSNVTASSNQQISFQTVLATGAGSTSMCYHGDYRATAGTTNGIYRANIGSATTITGTLVGYNADLSTNVTNAAQLVSAFNTTQLLSSTGRTNLIAGTGSEGQTCNFGWWSENLTLSVAGATTNTTNTIPADSFILAVDAYITTSITGVDSTAVQIGDSVTAARFASLAALTAGTVDVGLTHLEAAINSATTGAIVRAATTVRVTLSGGADNTPTAGAVRITVRYITFGAATS